MAISDQLEKSHCKKHVEDANKGGNYTACSIADARYEDATDLKRNSPMSLSASKLSISSLPSDKLTLLRVVSEGFFVRVDFSSLKVCWAGFGRCSEVCCVDRVVDIAGAPLPKFPGPKPQPLRHSCHCSRQCPKHWQETRFSCRPLTCPRPPPTSLLSGPTQPFRPPGAPSKDLQRPYPPPNTPSPAGQPPAGKEAPSGNCHFHDVYR